MAALTQARMTRTSTLSTVSLPLAASTAVYQGGMACYDTSAHVVTKGAAANANLVPIGYFNENVDNSASTATTFATVNLFHEITVSYWDNATGGNAVSASNLFTQVYILDDHTVTTSSSGNSKAGRVWGVDSANGVAIEAEGLI
jgi:hypothetical protein